MNWSLECNGKHFYNKLEALQEQRSSKSGLYFNTPVAYDKIDFSTQDDSTLDELCKEEAQKIRADAEKTRTVIISEAQRTSQETRGMGDGKAIQIYADSFGRDPEFFAFYRSMEAYTKSMGSDVTSMVLSPSSSFFRYFKDQSGN